MSTETLEFPPLVEPAAAVAVIDSKATDLAKIDLTDVALAMYGKWPDEVKAVKANLSTLVLDLSTPSKITEARSLRKRLILDPLAAARKVSQGIKSKMAQTSKAVGAELEKIEAGYTEADALILPKIEAAEAAAEAERAKKAKAEQERKDAHLAKINGIRAYAVKAETAPDMTAARVATAIQQLEGLPTPTKETFEEFAVEAANAICETLEKLRIIHARLLRAEQAEAEAAELRAKLEAQSRMDAPPAGPAGNGSQKPDDAAAIPGAEAGSGFTAGQPGQQVLKAEAATPDATDRPAPIVSPSVGSMGAGQAADAAPAGGSPELRAALDSIERLELPPLRAATGPVVMYEPSEFVADPRDELLRESLALTKYAAAPFFTKFPTHPKTTPEWWAGLREQIEALQPKLIAHLEG